MIKSKKLLIAVDGSPDSLKAVSYVALNCAAVNPRISLMYVISTAPEAFLDEARKLMLQADFREEDIKIIHRERLAGIAHDIISESSEGYDALVLGRKGSGKMQDLFPGSVS